jgi:hypothetical protein
MAYGGAVMRRISVLSLLVLGVLLAAAPASARAPVSEEACLAAGGPRAACVGLGKLGERIAAECARLGADAARCSVIGRRVVRSEIAAFEGSALARTLAFQRQLGDALGLRDAPFAGTHNSFNSTSEPATVSHTDSNQQLGLADQLRLGMRSLELDVHWIPSPRAGGALAAVLCHGQGNAGCTTERLLAERLPEVVAWLDANPREVVLLYLEDQIDDPAGYAAAAKVVRDALGSRLHAPAGPGCTTLPLDLTRAAVRAAGKQVVVVGDCGTGAWQGVSHSWPSSVRFETRPQGFEPYPACGGPEQVAARPKIVRYFEDTTFLAPLAAAAGLTSVDDGLSPATVREMDRCGTDLLGFDQLLPGDARLAALAWSWIDGPPAAGDPTCTARRGDGRWLPRACTARLRPTCRRPDGSWFVRARPTTRAAAGPACRRAGGAFRSPRTAFQNQRLTDAAGSGEAWIAYRPAPPVRRR